MREILQINVRIEMTLQTMDKTVNISCTVQSFVLGHVTVGVSQLCQQLARTQPRSQGPLSSSLEKGPWLRLVTCLCIPIKAAPGVGPQLNF